MDARNNVCNNVHTRHCVASNESKLTAAVLSILAVQLEMSLPQLSVILEMQVLEEQQFFLLGLLITIVLQTDACSASVPIAVERFVLVLPDVCTFADRVDVTNSHL